MVSDFRSSGDIPTFDLRLPLGQMRMLIIRHEPSLPSLVLGVHFNDVDRSIGKMTEMRWLEVRRGGNRVAETEGVTSGVGEKFSEEGLSRHVCLVRSVMGLVEHVLGNAYDEESTMSDHEDGLILLRKGQRHDIVVVPLHRPFGKAKDMHPTSALGLLGERTCQNLTGTHTSLASTLLGKGSLIFPLKPWSSPMQRSIRPGCSSRGKEGFVWFSRMILAVL